MVTVALLIAYCVMLVTEGIPVFCFELEIGQGLSVGVTGVCVIKCHPNSALLALAVLSCPAVSLCTTKSSLLDVSSTSSRSEN